MPRSKTFSRILNNRQNHMLDTILNLFIALTFATPANATASTSSSIVRVAPLTVPAVTAPKKRLPERVGVATTGRAAFVADVATGSVLYQKHAYDVLPIASLTKLMTAMVIMDANVDMEQKLVFAADDMPSEGSSVFAPGDVITREDALKAMLVGSVNEAGNLLARTSANGTQSFIEAMNAKAKSLRLASPVFVDPTGLDPNNRANAADVAAMLSLSMSYPELRKISDLASVTISTGPNKQRTVKSTNLLLSSFLNKAPMQIVGAKTGSLPQVGYNMAQLTRDEKGHEVVAVGLGSPNHFSRYQDVKAMTAWAFETFQWE